MSIIIPASQYNEKFLEATFENGSNITPLKRHLGNRLSAQIIIRVNFEPKKKLQVYKGMKSAINTLSYPEQESGQRFKPLETSLAKDITNRLRSVHFEYTDWDGIKILNKHLSDVEKC